VGPRGDPHLRDDPGHVGPWDPFELHPRANAHPAAVQRSERIGRAVRIDVIVSFGRAVGRFRISFGERLTDNRSLSRIRGMTTWDLPAGSGEDWVAHYDRGRPGWPDEVASLPGLAPSAEVLDLAAGSGKLTVVLRKRFDAVIAIEPQPAFRAILREHIPGLDVRDGTAQGLPVGDATLDAVFVAQAFHWFANRDSLDEIARVLRPGGVLVLMWNLPRGPWVPSTLNAERILLDRAPALDDAVDPLDFSRAHATDWRRIVEDSIFGPIQERRLPNAQILDAEGLMAYYASMGWIAELPDQERIPLLNEARSRLTADRYRRDWETMLFWCGLQPQ